MTYKSRVTASEKLKGRGHLAYCGLVCDGCPVRWATMEEEPVQKHRLKAAVARVLSEQQGENVSIDAVTDCDGCRNTGERMFWWCGQCPIRRCARERGNNTCADCRDYPCAQLAENFQADPAARSRLDVLRSVGGSEP